MIRTAMAVLCAMLTAGIIGAWAERLIGTPEMPPTFVAPDGAIHEDWGVVSVQLDPVPAGAATDQRYEAAFIPAVVSTTSAGPITLRQCVYRSPIWPAGVDVLVVKAESSEERSATLRLNVPDTVGVSERIGVAGGRPVLHVLSAPLFERKMKSWGCTGGVAALPGWAAPQGDCDPAFRNIRAGMGGVPIEYRFAVPAGGSRVVVLGFCESFHAGGGIRPLIVEVEGTPAQEVDPIAAWGRHVPGCLRFDAVDADNDGYIKAVVAPHPSASDKNPILNAVWVFQPGTEASLEEVKRGQLNGAAEYFVDAGGEKDQSIHEDGPVDFHLTLSPEHPVEMTFLLAAPGGTVPSPPSPWTEAQLYRAAVDVWGDWFDQGRDDLLNDSAAAEREALFRVALTRIQAGGFCFAMPVDQYAAAQAAEAIALLDKAELFGEAERLLRVYWDKDIPAPFNAFAQQADGSWRDAVNDPGATAHVLRALANHAILSKDMSWMDKAWPAIKAGAEVLAKSDPNHPALRQVAQAQALAPSRFQ